MKQSTPGPWYILEVGDVKFVAARPTEDHPYFNKTRNIDVCGDEDYPRKESDLKIFSASWEMGQLLLSAYLHVSHGGPTRAEVEAVLKKAGLL